MALPEHFLLIYGYALLFAWVLLEQLGLPLPALPALLAAGALSAQHELSFALALLAGLAASLMADSAWFLIGRRYGHHVLRLLCKLSLEPTVCVRRTQNSFVRRRAITIFIVAAAITGIFGANAEAATACATVLLLTTFLGIVPVGLIWAQLDHISLRKVTVESEHAEEAIAATESASDPALKE